MRLLIAFLLVLSANVYANEGQSSQAKDQKSTSVESMVKKSKKERRKKVHMCHDCGKPEPECTCEGEGHRKE